MVRRLLNSRRRPGRPVLSLLALTAVLALAAPLAAQEETAAGVQVDLAFGTGLDGQTRNLEGEGVAFPAATEKVFCLTRIRGLEAPGTVTHAWYHEGRTLARVDLPVGSADWRTWSSKRLLPSWTGHWEVKVLDASGKVLATAGFDVN